MWKKRALEGMNQNALPHTKAFTAASAVDIMRANFMRGSQATNVLSAPLSTNRFSLFWRFTSEKF